MSIFLFVPLISFAGLFFLRNDGVRESVAKSYIVLFLLMAVSTEALSLFGALTFGAISALWVALTVVSLGWLFLRLKWDDALKSAIKTRLTAATDYGRHAPILLLLVASVLSITLVVALIYPPNNWDSMTYHMSRVAEWIQYGRIEFYPTSIDRQNYQPPLAEFAILHLQLLSGSDRFANIVQWYSFLVSIVLATLIAKEFRLSRQAQIFSAVVASTVPMAILQSSSTQNDVVTAAFCMGFAYFLLRLVRTLSIQDTVFCALSLGLALLTKGTAYLYCGAIGLTIGAASLWSTPRPRRPELFAKLVAIVAAALVLNAGHVTRNVLVYGHVPSNASAITNEEIAATVIFSNMLRNAALHTGTPFDGVNSYSFRAIRKLLGGQLNRAESTIGTTSFGVPRFSLHEDLAGNPLHFVLTVLAFLILPFVRMSDKRIVYWYAISVLLGAVLYSAVLKWQPWASRLHTPIFVLAAPLIAAVVAGFQFYFKRLFIYVAVVLLAYGVPFLISNKTRPFTALAAGAMSGKHDRLRSYFVNRPELYDDYVAAAKLMRKVGADDVGLCFGYDDYEYPLWVLVGKHASRGTPTLRHVGVAGMSRPQKGQALPPPVLIMATKRLDANPIHGKGRMADDPCLDGEYGVVYESANIRIWKRKGT